MQHILSMEPEEAASGRIAPTRHRMLRRQSGMLSVLIAGLVIVYVGFNAAMVGAVPLVNGDWVHLGPGAQATLGGGAGPAGSVALSGFSLAQRLGFALVLALRAIPIGIVLFNLRSLFRLYSEGIVFAPQNAAHFKRIGLWLIVFAATPFATHELSVPIGNDFDDQWFHMEEVYALLLGSFLSVIAQVMAVGHEIEQDRDQFV